MQQCAFCFHYTQVKQRWAAPTVQEHAAATRVQCKFRSQRARIAAVRAAEYAAWYKHSQKERAVLQTLSHICLAVTTCCLLYVNLLFGKAIHHIHTFLNTLLCALYDGAVCAHL